MEKISRRLFLKSSALALTGVAARSVYPSDDGDPACLCGNPENSFQMLVMGDSVMWGQGLQGQNKFWYLTKRWLETEVYQDRRKVCAHIEAHSGATIIEQKRDRKSYIDPLRKFDGEINIGTPTILQQVENAAAYYDSRHISRKSVELVLLNGGANDLSIAKLVLPSFNFRTNIKKYCYTKMLELLNKTAIAFPNARIIVTGYYPIISEGTDEYYVCNLLNSLVKRNPCNLHGFKKGLDWTLEKMTKTSKIWYEDTNKYLQAAVNQINYDKPLENQSAFSNLPATTQSIPVGVSKRAFFAQVDFEKENAFAAANTYLWKVENFSDRDFTITSSHTNHACPDIRELQMKKIIKTDDELFGLRNAYCNCRDLRYKGFNLEKCYAAGTGHPNKEGAKEFARAIQFQLTGDNKYMSLTKD